MDPQEGADALAVLIVEFEAILALELVVDAGLLHLEAGGIDKDIEFVLFAFENRTLFVDLRDALAMGVDEVDVGAVEGRQVVVMEARALAHEHVPWLERFGRSLVLHYCI